MVGGEKWLRMVYDIVDAVDSRSLMARPLSVDLCEVSGRVVSGAIVTYHPESGFATDELIFDRMGRYQGTWPSTREEIEGKYPDGANFCYYSVYRNPVDGHRREVRVA